MHCEFQMSNDVCLLVQEDFPCFFRSTCFWLWRKHGRWSFRTWVAVTSHRAEWNATTASAISTAGPAVTGSACLRWQLCGQHVWFNYTFVTSNSVHIHKLLYLTFPRLAGHLWGTTIHLCGLLLQPATRKGLRLTAVSTSKVTDPFFLRNHIFMGLIYQIIKDWKHLQNNCHVCINQ